MAKRWKHWVRVAASIDEQEAAYLANQIIESEDFDAVVPRVASAGADGQIQTTILLCFRKQVEA